MGSKKTSKTKVSPYDKAAVNDGLSALKGANASAQATFEQFKPAQTAAIQQITDRMATPPEYLTSAREQLNSTINGEHIGQNPHMSALADIISQKVGSQYNSTFGSAGRAHGGMAALLSGQGVGDALQSFYGNQYNQERGLQQQAMMAAPAFHADENTDVNALFPAINNTAMGPLQAAAMYGSGIDNTMGRYTTSKTTEKTPFSLAQGLGLAMQMGSMFLPTGGLSSSTLTGGGQGPMPGMFMG